MTYQIFQCSNNPYIDFEGVDSRMINTLMTWNNYSLSRKSYSVLEKAIKKLFGMENVSIKDSSDTKFIIVQVTDEGKEHCRQVETFLIESKKQEEVANKVYSERWGIENE